MYRVLGRLALVCCATGSLCLLLAARAAEPTNAQAPVPLWDGQETIEQYAKRANLPPTMTLDLGNGVNLDLVLIPAGKFIMGTPEPKPVDKEGFRKKIIVGAAIFAVGVAVLLVLIGTVIIRAVRQRHRPQYSLARFIVMILAASVGLLGGMHWWFSTCTLAQAQAECKAALARYQSSFDEEKPAHQVTLTTPFYMAKYEVTQEQYIQVMGANPSRFKGASLPVEQVSWNDAQEFCKRTAGVPPATGAGGTPAVRTVRLPTEAEWEFACRAGTTTTYYSGDTEADLGRAAWHGANSKATAHPVGQKEPNAWGVCDMHGNLWEWCQNWYAPYKPEAAVDPQGPPQGESRVLRGGAWRSLYGSCRSASRCGCYPAARFNLLGFRVVVSAPTTP